MATTAGGTVGQRRWYYPALAMPGIVWLLLLFIMPFYAIAAVAFGTRDLIFALPVPAWNPLEWQFQTFNETARELFASGGLQAQFVRTLFYVGVSVVLCLFVGYPVAYYIARHGGRLKVLLLTLMIAPFWMSYLMRMLAWVNLLSVKPEDPGLINRLLLLTPFVERSDRVEQRRRLAHDGDPRVGLRLHPVLHPAAVRGARPDRQVPARGLP